VLRKRRGTYKMIRSQSVIPMFWKSTPALIAALIAAIGLLASASQSPAATLIWTNGSGVFGTASNWDPALAPATDDSTTFTNDTNYTISLNASTPPLIYSTFSNHSGVVTIDAGGNQWTVTNSFRIGVGDATSTVYLASGTLWVGDIDAPFVASQLRVADAGTNIMNCVASLFVTNGVVGFDTAVVGANATSVGSIIISGSGVVQDNGSGTATFSVGSGASNCRLIVTNGGKLSVFGTITVGTSASSTNNLALFSGPTSAGTMTSQGFRMSGDGGLLIISNGAKMYMAGQGSIGANSSFNTGIVVGAGSSLIIDGTSGLQVGVNSSGGTNNFFTVYDGASLLINNGTLAFGNNALHVNDGIRIGGPGAMSTGFAQIVRSASNNTNHYGNYFTVTNAFFSTRRIASQGPQETVSVLGKGTLVITNSLATPPATTNAVSFTGANSQLIVNGGTFANLLTTDNGGAMQLGVSGGNLLIVTNGGKLLSTQVTLGDGGNATLTSAGTTGIVSGVGSVWSNFTTVAGFTNIITIGSGATASNNYLAVLDGASLYNNGTLNIGNNTNAGLNGVLFGSGAVVVNTGSLNIGSGALSSGNSLTVSNASLTSGIINVGNSGALSNSLVFRGGTINVGFMRVRPTNTISFTAGTISANYVTIDSLANDGNAFVVGDGLSAAYYDMVTSPSNHNFNSGLVITNGASLRGIGTVEGQLKVFGAFAPGAPGGGVGSVVASNTLQFAPGAVFNVDLGTSSDSVKVGGNLYLNGTLNIADSGGFGVGNYTLITYAGTNSGSGTMTVGTTPNGSLNYAIDTNTAGSVILHVTSGGSDPYSAWLTQYGLTGGNALGTADPDGDGVNNTNEFLTGFNPNNSSANPHVISVVKSGSDVNITYLGASGDSTWTPGIASRTNYLEYTTGTGNGSYSNNFTSIQTNVLSGGTGLGTIASFVDTNGATGATRYYRVRVLVP
jgi:fibronectin-binding autotransporter adhesin